MRSSMRRPAPGPAFDENLAVARVEGGHEPIPRQAVQEGGLGHRADRHPARPRVEEASASLVLMPPPTREVQVRTIFSTSSGCRRGPSRIEVDDGDLADARSRSASAMGSPRSSVGNAPPRSWTARPSCMSMLGNHHSHSSMSFSRYRFTLVYLSSPRWKAPAATGTAPRATRRERTQAASPPRPLPEATTAARALPAGSAAINSRS